MALMMLSTARGLSPKSRLEVTMSSSSELAESMVGALSSSGCLAMLASASAVIMTTRSFTVSLLFAARAASM